MKDPFVESLLEKKSTCLNNPEKSSATKIQEHIPSGYLLCTQCSFDATKKSLIVIEVKIVWKCFVKI